MLTKVLIYIKTNIIPFFIKVQSRNWKNVLLQSNTYMLAYVTEYINKPQEYIYFPRRAEMAYSDTLKKKH